MQNHLKHVDPILDDQILICFSDQTNLFWLKALKRGFRHCEIYLKSAEETYIHLNSLSNIMTIQTNTNTSMARLFRDLSSKGHTCLWTSLPTSIPQEVAPLLPLTCVEVAKRLLGIHKYSILTPWQLYQYVKEQSKKTN